MRVLVPKEVADAIESGNPPPVVGVLRDPGTLRFDEIYKPYELQPFMVNQVNKAIEGTFLQAMDFAEAEPDKAIEILRELKKWLRPKQT